jgi:hypothetical protein
LASLESSKTEENLNAASVQFLLFPFTAAQIVEFRTPGTQILLGLSHPAYSHMAILPPETRNELAVDFD